MVEDRVTDGKRIAQLLASELTGLSSGSAARLDVADADPDAEPSADGTFAYRIELDGVPVGEVFVHEASARVDLSTGPTDTDVANADGLTLSTTDDGPLRVRIEYGAAVKRAVDLIRAVTTEN